MRMRCEKRWRSFSGGSTVIVDMSEAEFIDSTTLSVLIGARRQRYPIAVVAPSGTAAGRLAELVCLADMIPTYQTRAEALTDHDVVRHIAEFLKENNWPLEAKEDKVYGPHGPTAGPPPYTIFRIEPLKVFGLPGMTGMEQFDPSDLPKPTRWEFESVG